MPATLAQHCHTKQCPALHRTCDKIYVAVDVRFLRSLCRRVTPASLRVGSKEARRHTFMVGVTRNSGNLVLALGPVPSCPPGPTRAVVDFSDGGRQLFVAGLLTPAADGGAELVMESAPARRPSRSARLAPPADVAFAHLRRRGRRGRTAVLPDSGHRGARAPDREQRAARARHGAGGSRRSLPARGPSQRRGGRHQLFPGALSARTTRLRMRRPLSEHGPARVAIDNRTASERARDRRHHRACAPSSGRSAISEYEVAVSGPTGMVKGRMLQQAAIDRSRVPELRCRVNDADRLPIRSGAVTVECSLFGSGYRFYARITDRKGDVLTPVAVSEAARMAPPWRGANAARSAERGHRQLPPLR